MRATIFWNLKGKLAWPQKVASRAFSTKNHSWGIPANDIAKLSKRFVYAPALFLCLIALSGCEQTYTFETTDPMAYYQFADDEVNRAGKTILDFAGYAGVANADCVLLHQQHEQTVADLAKAKENLKGMAPFQKTTDFKDAAVALVAFHENYIRNSYKEWIEMRCKPARTSEEQAKMERIGSEYRDQLYKTDQAYQQARTRFVSAHQLPILLPPVGEDDYKFLK